MNATIVHRPYGVGLVALSQAKATCKCFEYLNLAYAQAPQAMSGHGYQRLGTLVRCSRLTAAWRDTTPLSDRSGVDWQPMQIRSETPT
jgi:hypothetical protein